MVKLGTIALLGALGIGAFYAVKKLPSLAAGAAIDVGGAIIGVGGEVLGAVGGGIKDLASGAIQTVGDAIFDFDFRNLETVQFVPQGPLEGQINVNLREGWFDLGLPQDLDLSLIPDIAEFQSTLGIDQSNVELIAQEKQTALQANRQFLVDNGILVPTHPLNLGWMVPLNTMEITKALSAAEWNMQNSTLLGVRISNLERRDILQRILPVVEAQNGVVVL